MIIEKIASKDHFKRNLYYFDRARDGFKILLEKALISRSEKVLLPAYIGWSPKEGSGVFDPVSETAASYDFYKLGEDLHIDMFDLKEKLEKGHVKIFVIIHYFGHVDPNYLKIIALVREYGCIILEDEAHSLFTDRVDGKSGRYGDAVIYSLHKMLPVKVGGALVLNKAILGMGTIPGNDTDILSQYDLYAVAACRKKNTAYLFELVKKIEGVTPLWGDICPDETLQTFPVIVEHVSRDVLYEEMNREGFGVVSLYHTLIPCLNREEYPVSHRLSQSVLNLPVHQDITEEQMLAMTETLQKIIKVLWK